MDTKIEIDVVLFPGIQAGGLRELTDYIRRMLLDKASELTFPIKGVGPIRITRTVFAAEIK